jgi:hypothetical protein
MIALREKPSCIITAMPNKEEIQKKKSPIERCRGHVRKTVLQRCSREYYNTVGQNE